MRRLLRPAFWIALALVPAACASDEDPGPDTTGQRAQVVLVMATSDHYVGAPQRLAVGLVETDGNRVVSFGSVDFAFSYGGTAEAPADPQPGPSAIGVYLPTPGTPDGSGGPQITLPADARGVYQAEDVTFDRAGFWQVTVTADIAGLGVQRVATTFPVLEDPAYPAPGEPALETENLTISSDDAPVGAIDSRAVNEGEVPDPELHEWTIARAVEQGRPALVIFSTPVYCESRFCGPVTDVVEGLAARFDERAVFIHVEIWREFTQEANVINQAAADWLLRDGDLTEPWLFLIGEDGTIVDRWGTLFRDEEVAAALRALPRMEA